MSDPDTKKFHEDQDKANRDDWEDLGALEPPEPTYRDWQDDYADAVCVSRHKEL